MEPHATIHELTAAFAKGAASPVAVAEAYLARIGALDEKVGAYLTVTRDGALAAARAAEARYRAGAPLSPVDGAPLAIKDVFCTAGVRTTCGSKILEAFVPPYDATIVARLRKAGAVLLGKTNMDEFAMGSSTEHSAFKLTRNPWDLTRVPGGSSGGSAAAVAGGLAAGAFGTDTRGPRPPPAAVRGGGRGGGGPRGGGLRHRPRRLRAPAGGVLRRRRAQADLRARVPLRANRLL